MLAALVLLSVLGSSTARAATNPSVDVAEAALAQARASLLRSWPDSATKSMPFDAGLIRARFSQVLYPDPEPGLGPFAGAVAFDDLTPVQPAVGWDSNGNGRLLVQYRGASGSLVCSKEAVVERELTPQPPRGIVLYVGDDLVSNGAGNNPKIRIEVPPPVSLGVSALVGGAVDDSTLFQPGIAVVSGPGVPPLDEVMPPVWVSSLVDLAMDNGRYFTSFVDAVGSPVSELSPQGGLSGLCVVQPPAASQLLMPSTQINTEYRPGCLVILGSSELSFSGLCRYYGVVYAEGGIEASHGAGELHGMLATGASFRVVMNVLYNDDCVSRAVWPRSVVVVPGTSHWLDAAPPASSQTGADGGWHSAPATISFSAQDEPGGSGVERIEYRLDEGDWASGTSVSVSSEGPHSIAWRAIDHAGNIEPSHTATLRVDGTPPATEAGGVDAAWHTTPVTVTLSASDAGSGVARTEYSLDEGSTWTTGTSLVISAEGRTRIDYRSLDVAGNVEPSRRDEVLIDSLPPVTGDDWTFGWHNSDADIALHPSDAGSGVVATFFTIDGRASQSGTRVVIEAKADHSADACHTVRYWSVDAAGNVEDAVAIPVAIDTLAPSSAADAPSGWVTKIPVVVSLTGDDGLGSGLAVLESSIDGGSTWQPGGARAVSDEGTTSLLFRAVDVAGNVGAAGSADIRIDTRAPETAVSGADDGAWYGRDVTLTLAGTDQAGGSGFSRFIGDLDGAFLVGSGSPYQVTVAAPSDHSRDGTHTLSFSAVDTAGNAEAVRHIVVQVDTRRPRPFAPSAVRVRRYATARLGYQVLDAGPSSGRAGVTIRIRTVAGKLVKRVVLSDVPVNVPHTIRFRCTLRRGAYRFEVYANDGAGNRELRPASNRLTVF